MSIVSLPDSPWKHQLPSPEEMASFDRETIAQGTAVLDLMEKAGEGILREIKERYSFELYSQGTITVLAGTGNNGGDGLVAARLLKAHGYKVSVILASAERASEELLEQIDYYRRSEGDLFCYPAGEGVHSNLTAISLPDLESQIRESTVVIDALLGTGQKNAPRGAVAELIQILNSATAGREHLPRIVAVDIPSGVNGDTAQVYEPAVTADMTVALELIKRGLMQYPGRSRCGEIWAVSIGVECRNAVFSIADTGTVRWPGKRPISAHKGDFGSVFVVGGSRNMPGAPALSASAALSCGSGIIRKAHLQGELNAVCPPEVMLQVVPSAHGFFRPEALDSLRETLLASSCVVLGPGLGIESDTAHFVRAVLQATAQAAVPVVLDADALNCVALLRKDRHDVPLAHTIMTPHPGEAARLLGVATAEIQNDRYGTVAKLAALSGGTVLLKGPATIVFDGTRGTVNTSGNPYMATPGSGDVLAGVIASLLGQGFSPFDAAVSGAFFHGRAGDEAFRRTGGPITASQMIECLSTAMKALNE